MKLIVQTSDGTEKKGGIISYTELTILWEVRGGPRGQMRKCAREGFWGFYEFFLQRRKLKKKKKKVAIDEV